jgi:ATP-dependent RNA helicase DeaD
MNTFSAFNLPSSLETSLKAMNYETPTDVQMKVIPTIMSGKDILASAPTGTGKTGAFAIPTVAKLLEDPSKKALIMAPTRELAEQVYQDIMKMVSRQRQIGVVLLIGGVPIFKQFSRLRDNPQIVVGTPGRIYDHITRGKTARAHESKLDVSDVSILILDEADRMLDMGFGDQLEAIVKEMPKDRQTLMFSATFPKGIKAISQRYLRDPERFDVGAKHQLNVNLTHESIFVEGRAKYSKLVEAIKSIEGTIIVFANTKRMCDQLTDSLNEDEGIDAVAMHGDLKQSQRTRVIAGFRSKRYKVLIATDVAARGLDIPHVETVINYDLPMSPEDYIHRVGRTARAGAKGHALDLVSSIDKTKLAIIKRLLLGEDMDFIKQTNKRAAPSRGGYGGDRRGGDNRGGYGGERRSYGGDSRGGDNRGGYGGERRSYGGDSRGGDNRGGERRSFGDRPQGDRPFGERKSFGDRPQGDRPFGERKSFGDRPQGDRPFGERKSFGDRPQGERKPFGERKAFGDRPQGERKPFGERKAFGDRPQGERKPFGERKAFGDRPQGERKPFGERKAFGDRPQGERKPFGDRPQGERKPFVERKPFGDKTFSDRKKPGSTKTAREPRFPEEFIISQ